MFGYALGTFALALLIAVLWLLISKTIPPLRHRLRLRYGVAMVLALTSALVPGDPEPIGFLGAIVCVGVLLWWYKGDSEKTKSP